jgi:uncharacterized protein (DUF2252 family)
MMSRAWPEPAYAYAIAVVVLALSAGCGGVNRRVSRSDWLARELLARHADLLARDPQAVAEKLDRMAGNRFDYFRGSAALLPPSPSRFTSPAASGVAVLGDPHPENIGTYPLPDGAVALDFNDFDLAGRGPFTGDLQRLALGLWVAGDMAGLGKKQRVRLVEALTEAYLQEIRAMDQGGVRPPFTLRADTAFDGGLDEILAKPDTLDEGRPLEVTGAERAALAAALLEYRRSLLDPSIAPPAVVAVKRAVRSRAGISSFPLLRYRVVVEGPGPATDDDWTLELKESREREAATVVRLQRQMQERPDLDPHLGWTKLEGKGMRVRRLSPQHRRLSVERLVDAIKSPHWGKKDLRALARDAGRLLARAHGRPPTTQGEPGARAIARAAGDGRGLTYETVQLTESAAETLEQDRQHLRALIKERGPLLGWQPGKR